MYSMDNLLFDYNKLSLGKPDGSKDYSQEINYSQSLGYTVLI